MCKVGVGHFGIELLKEDMSKFEGSSMKQPKLGVKSKYMKVKELEK